MLSIARYQAEEKREREWVRYRKFRFVFAIQYSGTHTSIFWASDDRRMVTLSSWSVILCFVDTIRGVGWCERFVKQNGRLPIETVVLLDVCVLSRDFVMPPMWCYVMWCDAMLCYAIQYNDTVEHWLEMNGGVGFGGWVVRDKRGASFWIRKTPSTTMKSDLLASKVEPTYHVLHTFYVLHHRRERCSLLGWVLHRHVVIGTSCTTVYSRLVRF